MKESLPVVFAWALSTAGCLKMNSAHRKEIHTSSSSDPTICPYLPQAYTLYSIPVYMHMPLFSKIQLNCFTWGVVCILCLTESVELWLRTGGLECSLDRMMALVVSLEEIEVILWA